MFYKLEVPNKLTVYQSMGQVCMHPVVLYVFLHRKQGLSEATLSSSRTRRLPVLYVFGCEAIDTAECVATFRRLFPETGSHVLVLYDTLFSHCIGQYRCSVTMLPMQ